MSEEIDLEDFAPWLVVILLIMGGWARLFLLDSKGMWLDETFSVWLANKSVGEMLGWIVKIDQHPPLYYLLLHAWIALKDSSPYHVRLLSALFGIGTIPIIYLIGKRISGVGLGLGAAVFLALSPYHIYYAQETRMYTLLAFNAAVALYALVCLLTDSRSAQPIGSQFREYLRAWRTHVPEKSSLEGDGTTHRPSLQMIETDLAWVLLMGFSAATLLTHNTAVLFILATNLFVFGLLLYQRLNPFGSPTAFQIPSLKNWMKAQLGIFILWSPWLLTFIRQVRSVDQEFWLPKPGWNTIVQTLRAFLNASASTQASQVMTWSLCALLCLGLVYFRKKLSIILFLITLFAVPFLGELLVSLRRPIFYDKTLIWITIPMFLLLAAGVTQLRFRLFIIGVVGLLCTNYLFSAGDYYRWMQKEDWLTPAGYVANFAQNGDLVLFNSNFVVISFDYYFEPYEDLYSIQIERLGVPLDLYQDEVLEPKMTEADIPGLLSMLHDRDRVWLVYSHNDYTDPLSLIPQTLATKMELTQTREFYGGQVQLYETP
ncbi:MAG: glycosyltransferase family 39 protein [Anaerolineales bacterium]|nr:glycosyltransferase family 39 protein [Anaerolineales bacterium]